MDNTKLFKITYLDYDEMLDGYPEKDFAHVRANVQSVDELHRAYEAGCSIIGVDLLSRSPDSTPLAVNLGQMARKAKVEQRGYVDGNEFLVEICKYEDNARFGGEGFLRREIWLLVTMIGNPDLTMILDDQPYPRLFIGGSEVVENSGIEIRRGDTGITEDFLEFRSYPRTKNIEAIGFNQFKIIWGKPTDFIYFWVYVETNVGTVNELASAYMAGARLVGVDIRENRGISEEKFKIIKSLAHPDDLYYSTDIKNLDWSLEDAEEEGCLLGVDEHFIMWRTLARIGKPDLYLEVVDDAAPNIDLG